MILNDVTLVCVSGIRHEKSVESLLKCSANIKFNSVKFISDQKPDNCGNQIQFIQTDPIKNHDQYSRFILYELYKHIDTDFCMIVQHDGYITDVSKWRSDFIEYDYIGAPWPIRDCYVNQFGEQCRVGNGGFSLRSKRLLTLPSELNVNFDIGEWKNEDLNFCIFNKHIYESKKMRFAPLEIARYFSHELYIPELNGITPFGIHGKTL